MPVVNMRAKVETVAGLETVSRVRDFEFTMDEPASLGGTDKGMNPVEALLSAIGGCKVIVAQSFAAAHQIHLRSLKVTVDGKLDTDGFTGKNPKAKMGLMDVTTHYAIDAENSREEIEEFVEFIEKTCPVIDTLVNTPNIETKLEIL